MSDAALFTLIFGGLFVLRVLLATIFFALILPDGDRCPNCDARTLRLKSVLFESVLPWFRRSWCLACGWRGVLRRGAMANQPAPVEEVARR